MFGRKFKQKQTEKLDVKTSFINDLLIINPLLEIFIDFNDVYFQRFIDFYRVGGWNERNWFEETFNAQIMFFVIFSFNNDKKV